MSIAIFTESAQTIELAKNIATAVRRMGFRPQMSDSLAHIGPAAAFARRYAAPIQVYPLAECKSADMVGIAVATIVWSRAAMNKESCNEISSMTR